MKLIFRFFYSIYFHIMKILAIIFFGTISVIGSILILPFGKKIKLAFRHKVGKYWGKTILFLSGISFEFDQQVQLNPDENYIFAGNHQSSLDIYIYYAYIPTTIHWIAKKLLFYIPFLGWAMYFLGHIAVERENSTKAMIALKRAVNKIKTGISIAIFPEGTRSKDGKLLPLKKGAFAMAKLSRLQIIPIIINNAFKAAPKGKLLLNPFEKVKIILTSPLDSRDKNVINTFKERINSELE